MPQTKSQTYQVAPDTMLPTRPRRVTRPRQTEEVTPQLPTPKEPTAAIAPAVPTEPVYNVQPREVPALSKADGAPSSAPVEASNSSLSYDDPAITALQRAADLLEQAQNAPIRKVSRGRAALQMIGTGLSSVPGGNSWSDVARQVGAGAGAAISGAVEPRLPGAKQKLYNVAEAEHNLANTQKYAATASLGNYRNQSLDIRRDKMDLDEAYRKWRQENQGKLTNDRLDRTKFLQGYMTHKQLTADVQNAFMNDYRNRTLGQREEEFDERKKTNKARIDDMRNRTKAYIQSVDNAKLSREEKSAASAAAGQALLDAADDYDDLLKTLDPVDDYEDINAIKREQREAKRKGQALVSGAKAGAEVRNAPTTTPSAPVKDTTRKGGGVRPTVSTKKLQGLLGVN